MSRHSKKKNYNTKVFLEELSKSLKVDDSKNLTEWIEKNELLTEDNHPYTFENRKYLIDIMNDESKKQVIVSSAQVGKTVMMYIKALYQAMKGKNVVYSLPTQDLSDMLVKSKLNRIIDNNPVFKSVVKGDNLREKLVKDRMLYSVYTNGTLNIGFSSDLNIYDECSDSNQDTLEMLSGRQLNSPYRWEWAISNPLAHGDYLDKMWSSPFCDQKHWTIKCSKCSKWQILNYDGIYDFKGNVCKERGIFVCQYCDREMSTEDRINGIWVPRFHERAGKPETISGYWMHYLMRDSADIHEMIQKEKSHLASFKRMYLGQWYNGSEVNVTPKLFRDNRIEPLEMEKNHVLGIDIGSSTGHHYVYGADNVVTKIGKFKDFDEIRQFIRSHPVKMVVLDLLPERESAVKLRTEFPNLVFTNYYHTRMKGSLVDYKEDEQHINSNKHLLFDKYIKEISEKKYRFAFSEYDKDFEEFCDQFSTLYLEMGTDNSGNPTMKWLSSNSNDHYANAFLYFNLAMERLQYISPKYSATNINELTNTRKVERQDESLFLLDEVEESDDWYNL